MIELYGQWKGVRVEEKHFPSFLLIAWNTLRGESPSFTTFQVGQEEQEAVGQRYVGNDFWVFTEEQTGINSRDAFDPCPRGSVWKDRRSYDWPGDLVYLNPPFNIWSSFYSHAMEQKEKFAFTNMLFIMPFDRYYGYQNAEPCQWVKKLHDCEKKKVFATRYRYFLPDGTRHERTFHTICVHVF